VITDHRRSGIHFMMERELSGNQCWGRVGTSGIVIPAGPKFMDPIIFASTKPNLAQLSMNVI
jgi:hypothetical protein